MGPDRIDAVFMGDPRPVNGLEILDRKYHPPHVEETLTIHLGGEEDLRLMEICMLVIRLLHRIPVHRTVRTEIRPEYTHLETAVNVHTVFHQFFLRHASGNRIRPFTDRVGV